MNLEERFAVELRKSGSVYGVIEAYRIRDIKIEVETQQSIHAGKADCNYYADAAYDFGVLEQPEIRSVFILATPSPYYILRVEGSIDLRIPPIYGNREAIVRESRRITDSIFPDFGFMTYPVVLPKKALAVHSGLATYGNNGLAYVKEFGSYVRLTAFASDYEPQAKPEWNELTLMKSCASCGKCVAGCPCRAIVAGTAWVDTNRCLTRYNEQSGDFPSWLGGDSHNCLVGCAVCQEVCPQNYRKAREVVIEVGPEPLKQLLVAVTWADLDEQTRDLLGALCLERYFPVLKRNIKMLLDK